MSKHQRRRWTTHGSRNEVGLVQGTIKCAVFDCLKAGMTLDEIQGRISRRLPGRPDRAVRRLVRDYIATIGDVIPVDRSDRSYSKVYRIRI